MSIFAIVDYRIKEEAINCLSHYTDKIIFTKPLNVNSAINGHSDIGVCKISDNEIVVCPSQYDYYKSELPGVKVTCGGSEPDYKYPDDIIYNVACGNDVVIHNFAYTDKITLAVINQKFSKHINVQQGYSKCSICFLKSNAMITDDDSIYKSAVNCGIDVIKISKGDIKLKGMNYGFFGGSTGYYDNKLFLNGEIKFHKAKEIINEFLKKHNVELIEIKKGHIEDIGSIIFLSGK